jgi:lysine 2,3-aminomutase
LPSLRAVAPDAVLRLEWWLESGVDLVPLIPVLCTAQPLFVHAVVTVPGQIEGRFGPQVQRLLDAGVPLAAELVLRLGGLDRPEVVRSLCLGLLKLSVRPYVMVDGAWLPAAERVPRAAALEIVRGLRGWISGLAVPQLVEESASGVRTPVIPAYLERLDEGGVEVVNYEGRRLRYANPPENPE